jgi:DNA polymerase-4
VPSERAILHLDMDAFFAAIEQLDDPALRGRPVLVGSDDLRGVVATASYEARPYGCHSAQPMEVAKRLCPHAVVVPCRFSRYREVSERLFEILESFTPVVQPLSIDEAFLDVTGTQRLHSLSPVLGAGEREPDFAPAREVARKLKARVREALCLTASVGVAPNKFLAAETVNIVATIGVHLLIAMALTTLLAWLASAAPAIRGAFSAQRTLLASGRG